MFSKEEKKHVGGGQAIPMACVVLRRPDLSDEDTWQCKPFADSSDGHHRARV